MVNYFMDEKTTNSATDEGARDGYQISAVAKLTGLSVHTIRAWEKRYGAVEPVRTGTQRRVYSQEDVRKLTLLKMLVDAGQSISSVAGLPVSKLEERVDQASEARFKAWDPTKTAGDSDRSWSVGIVGAPLQSLIEAQAHHFRDLKMSAFWHDLAEALECAAAESQVDLLLVDVPALFPEQLHRIQEFSERTHAFRVVIVYGFCQQDTLDQIGKIPRFTALRAPVNATGLRLAILPSQPAPSRRPLTVTSRKRETPDEDESDQRVPVRIFTPEQLSRLARLSPSIRCECPQHLANLITSLAAFEAYSAECENRNEEDAALHAYLHRTTAEARHEMEVALERVLETEQIQI